MTEQERKNKIKELEKQIAELKATEIEEQQSKRWKPEYDEPYFYVGTDGSIYGVNCGYKTDVDDWRYLIGNCFKTEEEAEEYKKQIEYTAKYKNYVEEHNNPLDWNNGNQPKYYVCFQQSCAYKSEPLNQIKIYANYWSKEQGAIYTSSEQIIHDAIAEIGEHNFKKYVLEVK